MTVAGTQAERITALEIQMGHMLEESHKTNIKLDHTNTKLDELLNLRSKGVGAFWLASALTGTGIIGFSLQLLDWLKGTGHG